MSISVHKAVNTDLSLININKALVALKLHVQFCSMTSNRVEDLAGL